MLTLARFITPPDTIPAATAWQVAELSEARGKQELFTRQSPQRLRALREHALIESAVASNRIEGVIVAQARIRKVVFGRSLLRDRDEEEVRGYRDALNEIHAKGAQFPIIEKTLLRLHAMAKGETWDAGRYKERDGDIIEKYPDGRERVRFCTTTAADTPAQMAALIEAWSRCIRERWVHPLVALAVFNLDFLCIHPFRDGNGRVSRLLLLLQCYHLGFEVGRYISIERLIEQHKERYYETLEQCSQGWHEGKNDPWPYVNFVLSTLRAAYSELEQRVGQVKEPKGAKVELVEAAIQGFGRPFAILEIERACPGVSRDHIRKVLQRLKREGRVESLGRGPGASWKTAKAVKAVPKSPRRPPPTSRKPKKGSTLKKG